MYDFTKNAIIEVNFSHRRKSNILKFGPNCTHCCQLLYVELTWCEFSASTITRKKFEPPKAFIKTLLCSDFFQALFC